jgi:hypothetical protein
MAHKGGVHMIIGVAGVMMVAEGEREKSEINSGNIKKDCSNSFGS